MKKIVFLALFITPFVLYGQNIYRDSNLHYSFTIPEDWAIIPRQTIDNYLLSLQRSTGRRPSPIDNGIQIIKSQNNVAYMFMQHHNEKITWDEFIEIAGSVKSIEEIKDDLAQKYDLLKLFNSRSCFVDTKRRMIIHSLESNPVGLEQQITVAVFFLGKNSIIQFNINYFSSKANEYLKDVYTIIDSFKFDDGYEYK